MREFGKQIVRYNDNFENAVPQTTFVIEYIDSNSDHLANNDLPYHFDLSNNIKFVFGRLRSEGCDQWIVMHMPILFPNDWRCNHYKQDFVFVI